MTVPEFLAKLDNQYTGKKMMGQQYWVYDEEGTAQRIKESILSSRRDGSLTKGKALEEWDLQKDFELWSIDFTEWAELTEYFRDDWYEMSTTKENDTWTNFWTWIWEPHIKPELKATAAKERLSDKSGEN